MHQSCSLTWVGVLAMDLSPSAFEAQTWHWCSSFHTSRYRACAHNTWSSVLDCKQLMAVFKLVVMLIHMSVFENMHVVCVCLWLEFVKKRQRWQLHKCRSSVVRFPLEGWNLLQDLEHLARKVKKSCHILGGSWPPLITKLLMQIDLSKMDG